ncbi:MAG: putative Ig domain-containing protein [Planctomycetes bacterium]|nr:putative Ig domain-containing protein [Planctomycetota bacterium]MCW8136459.1 putative Ig domain-containing protein [Planctomycetota bacterium]
MAPRTILKVAASLTLFALLAIAAPDLSAQWPQAFPTLNTLPTGWQLKPGSTGTNLWNVDANGTYRPSQPSTTFVPYAPGSGPYSLNWNNGTNAYNNSNSMEGGVLTPTLDLTYAPNPVLSFQHLRDYFYYYSAYPTTYLHAMIVRVWDTTLSTIHYQEEMTAALSVGQSALVNWTAKNITLNRNWGQVRVEFAYKSDYGSYYEQNSAGWFIDEVNVAGLTPPTLGISNPNALGSHPAGSPLNGGSGIQLTAQNGTPPYHSWQLVNSVLPPGLTLGSSTGLISGTPTDAGNYGFTIQVRDSGAPQLIAQKTFSMLVTRPASFTYPVMTIPYTEDFSTDTGWVYSTNNVAYGPSGPGMPYTDTSAGGWERGYATQSSPASAYDYGDPAFDRSSTSDNMLLGVKIGGPVPTNVTLNAWYWAYSPQITITGYRTVEVKFWKWLNAYYYYYHPCEVEIWNPFTSQWVDVWVMQYGEDRDNAWMQIARDYDFGQNPGSGVTTRLRFGYSITQTYAITTYHSGGWNVDDIQVIEKPQPGIVQITQLEMFSTQYVGSTPKVYVGQVYPIILRVQNTSPKDVEIHTFSYTIHLGGTPQNVGTLQLATTPSSSNPWVIPGNQTVYISNTSGPQIAHIDFNCTALAPSGNGTSVILHVEMLGKEVGTPPNRATISNSQTDPSGDEVFTVFSLPALALTDPTNLPSASINVPYQFTFTAQYGTAPYVNWAKTAGPAWMTLTNNTLTFTATPVEVPNPPQQFQVTIYVEDSATPAANAQKTFNILIDNAGGPVPLQIVTGSQLPNATELQSYSPVQFNASGGTPPYTWTNFQWLGAPAGNGALAGMSFNTGNGQFGGTPGAGTVGGYAFNITLNDSAAGSVTRTFYISVLPQDSNVGIITPATQGATGAPPNGLETSPYNGGVPFQFQATGGFTGPSGAEYHWAVTSGQIPPGLVLNPDSGTLGGTPTTAGTYQFTLRASDGAFPPESGSQTFTIQIDPLIPQPLQIMTTSNLPQGHEGNPYQVLMEASFGRTPYTWRMKSGSTPPTGLGINSTTGEFGGVIITGQATPPNQDFTFTIEVEDSSAIPEVAEKTFTMNIVAFIPGALTITTAATLPEGGVMNPYSVTIRATGGNPANPVEPYQYFVQVGSSLPLGLSLAPNGRLDGTPLQSQAGTHTFTIDANDGAGGTASKTFTLQINGGGSSTDDSITITPGRRKSELVPFWEACSAGPAGSGTALLLMLGLAAGAMYLRRRRA